MRALIIGIAGQDGSYLAELLISKGYEVHGTVRATTRPDYSNLKEAGGEITLHTADVTDAESISHVLIKSDPDEIYNLAAQSHVGASFQLPVYTMEATGCGALNVLEAIRHNCSPKVRFYQASSSEMFGNQPEPQSEATPFAPVSPYGCAKLYAHNMARAYRQAYGMHISCGILFNHESPRRGESFVTRKICKCLAAIKAGLQDKLVLGNMDAHRDWGYAPEYCEAMWLMLQQEAPDDYVIGTGKVSSVRYFLECCLEIANLDAGVVTCSEALQRPTEIVFLRANPAKASLFLGWRAKTKVEELARIMMKAELKAVGFPRCL